MIPNSATGFLSVQHSRDAAEAVSAEGRAAGAGWHECGLVAAERTPQEGCPQRSMLDEPDAILAGS
jgi:hypothetical protein